jgi:hypothetical protein
MLQGAGGGGEPPSTLPDFVLQSQTTALAAAKSAASNVMSTRKQRTTDYWIKKLKDAGVWAKLSHLWIADDVAAGSLINWKTPGTGNLSQVGAPTFTSMVQPFDTSYNHTTTGQGRVGFRSTAAANYVDTGIPLSSIDGANFSFGCYLGSGSSTNWAAGAVDAVATSGILIGPRGASGNTMQARAMGGTVSTIGAAADWGNGQALFSLTRDNTATFRAFHNGVNVGGDIASAVVQSAQTTTLTFLKANTLTAVTDRPLMAAFLGTHLTDGDMELLYRAIRSVLENNQFGDVLIHEPGYQPQAPSADVVVYGWTAQGVLAAYEAKRQGKSVIMVGGWRDRTVAQIGGMMANGLGRTDLEGPTYSVVGGLTRLFFKRANSINDVATPTATNIVPMTANWLHRQSLDPARTGGLDIELFAANGVASVQKTGAKITSLTTVDGRTFSAAQFIDASYEGDLMAAAGVSFNIGREAKVAGGESINGYRGTLTGNGSNKHQFTKDPNGSALPAYTIDSYVVPGNPASGLLYGVGVKPVRADGAADAQTQAFTFRLSLTNSQARRVPFSAVAPAGYARSNYEALGRLAAAMTAGGQNLAEADWGNFAAVGTGTYDLNNQGGMSMDFIGESNAYVAATTYAQREVSWKAHEAWVRGIMHYMAVDTDSRIVGTAARTSVQAYGYPCDHYMDPHPNDLPYFPTQLYVREHRRMVNDFAFNADDMKAADGTAPRSTHTVAVASYPLDSHHGQRFDDGGRIWNEGQILDGTAGGADLMAPLPYEIYVPRASECTNLATLFAVACTHTAFGAIRMEPTAMCAGQSIGMAAAIAIEEGCTIQEAGTTLYASHLRPRLLASPTLTGEQVPVLPQVN